jgi:hypothetical protein
MRLSPEQIERFYAIWKPLILFVNQRLHIEPTMFDARLDGTWAAQKVYAIREALWANDSIREAFIAENPAQLSAADLAIVESWRFRVAGKFYVFRHLKKHSILIQDSPSEIYAVLGLASTLAEIVPFTPCYAQAVLLPFEEQIIYDSLIMPYNIFLGPGIRRNLAEIYKDAKERGAIITSLLPQTQPASREEKESEVGHVNDRVLEAFRKQLYRSGLSPKVVERDAASVAAFADHCLTALPTPCSLRDFRATEVKDYLDSLPSARQKASQRQHSVTGLTRFLRFLRDTERMEYRQADAVLKVLRGRA